MEGLDPTLADGCTEVIEIQGEKPLKSVAPPPPTAQTPGPIFWREPPHVNAFRGTEAIFEFHPGIRDTGTFRGF